MITVEKRNYLDALPNKTIGEYALVVEEGRVYQYTEQDTWEPMTISGEGLSVSLYDINQNVFAQLQPMNDENLRIAHSDIYRFLGEDFSAINEQLNYWALICWPKHYATIFHHIKDITVSEDNKHVEIWITDEESTECYVLFYYSNGIVEGVA